MRVNRVDGEILVFTEVPFEESFDAKVDVIEDNILHHHHIYTLFEMDTEENIMVNILGGTEFSDEKILEIISEETNKFLK